MGCSSSKEAEDSYANVEQPVANNNGAPQQTKKASYQSDVEDQKASVVTGLVHATDASHLKEK